MLRIIFYYTILVFFSFLFFYIYYFHEKAMMEKEPNMYADLVASNLPVDGPIEEDIPRTMYDHEMFCRKSRVDGRSMLRRVLTAYGRYDKEVCDLATFKKMDSMGFDLLFIY